MIGNPEPSQVSNRQLRAHLVPALEWLAQELEFNLVNDDQGLGLVADVNEYTLPNDILWILNVSWNGLPLEAKSLWFWDREGTPWRDVDSQDVLTQYAVHGRQLILIAPPSSTAITTDPALHMRYVAAPPLLDGTGVLGLSDMDQYIAIARAALRYCRTHPSDENNLKVQSYAQEIAEHLPLAKKRVRLMVQTHLPSFLPYSERTGGAR